ncbi:MAG TPA: CRISPR-associated endonuclease Cas2 [Chthonomonadales bacterium]|nr:CRISPR-associated endonuclease Cas2 [Chthonomonadales bacterium]
MASADASRKENVGTQGTISFGGVRAMWVLAMFDLPVATKVEKRNYLRFRSALIDDGFIMLQYSVYARPCPSDENAAVHVRRVELSLPPEGQVRILTLTDMQFARMRIFLSKKSVPVEKQPEQLSFF